MEKLPTHIDVPRLCKKISVVNNGDVVFDGKEEQYNDKNNAEVTRTLLGLVLHTTNYWLFDSHCRGGFRRRRLVDSDQSKLRQDCC